MWVKNERGEVTCKLLHLVHCLPIGKQDLPINEIHYLLELVEPEHASYLFTSVCTDSCFKDGQPVKFFSKILW